MEWSCIAWNLLTGKLLGETRFDDRDATSGMQREETVEDVELPGALPDVLVDDGQYIYLRDKVLDSDGVEQDMHVPHLYSSAGLLDDHWWHRTSWLWGERNWGRASGWAVMPGIRPSGRILVTDDATVFGYGRKSVQGQLRSKDIICSEPTSGSKNSTGRSRTTTWPWPSSRNRPR